MDTSLLWHDVSEADTLKLHVYDLAVQHHVRVLNEAAIKSG